MKRKTWLGLVLLLSFCSVSCDSGQGKCTQHSMEEIVAKEYLKEYDGYEGYAEFYKSCKNCGERSSDVFEISVNDAQEYAPTSPTLTMYETEEKLSYGFTWNCMAEPLDSGVMIRKNSNADWQYYKADVVNSPTHDASEQRMRFYVCKAIIDLEPNVQYTYKLVENILEVESEEFTFTSVNPNADSFSFASFSDSQSIEERAFLWTQVLENVSDVDFYLHSGDILENTKRESNWTNMFNGENKPYFATKPMMIAAGNHDTTYKSGKKALYNHFNNNIPEQCEIKDEGYFYSFTYGNTKFIMLNTNEYSNQEEKDYSLPEKQYAWLVNQLTNNDATWTVVTMHNPMYSIGRYGGNEMTLALREQLSDLFTEYGVDLVIQGHDHNLFRSYPIGDGYAPITATVKQEIDGVEYQVNPQGTIYIMNGPTGDAGKRVSDVSFDKSFFEIYEDSGTQSWAEYTVTDTKFTVTVKSIGYGNIIEHYSWGILKSN